MPGADPEVDLGAGSVPHPGADPGLLEQGGRGGQSCSRLWQAKYTDLRVFSHPDPASLAAQTPPQR